MPRKGKMMGARTQTEREVEKREREEGKRRRNKNGGDNGGRGKSFETKKRLISVVNMNINKVNRPEGGENSLQID